MQDERNERVMRDVEAVSQDSSGSGATLGESLRSLEVEIGSADGTGNLGQIDASGNMEGVQDENSNRGPAQPEIVLETLPDCFDNLKNLQDIDLSKCHNLERLPKFFAESK